MASRKLNNQGKRLIIERVVAGDTNEQVRDRLAENGFSRVTDSTLTHYRSLPEVRTEIERRDTVALQSGFALRHRRIEELNRLATALHRRLLPKPDSFDLADLEAPQIRALNKSFVEVVDRLGRLVDTTIAQQKIAHDEAVTSPRPEVNDLGMLLSAMNKLDDQLTKQLAERDALAYHVTNGNVTDGNLGADQHPHLDIQQ